VVVGMTPLGYLYKRVALCTDGMDLPPHVHDIYSVSSCISDDFADYIPYWKHNGFWLFDTPQVMHSLVDEHSISLEGLKLFYYEAYEQQYDEDENSWSAFEPEAAFRTQVLVPIDKTLEGFDIVSFRQQNAPECSVLSCNGCAIRVSTNTHCLFETFADAKRAIDTTQLGPCESGPYRIIAVYSIRES
jgi:hypothetical protein